MSFDPTPYLMKLKGKDYLPVAARVAWFRSDHPDWGILTEEVYADEQRAKYRATVMDANGRIISTATKLQTIRDFGNFTEKAETGAVGRAVALAGYGTTESMEFAEDADDPHIVDTPIESSRPAPKQPPAASQRPVQPFQQAGGRGVPYTGKGEPPASLRASASQLLLIKRLQGGKPAPEGLTMKSASDLIERLQREEQGRRPAPVDELADPFVDAEEGS